MIGAADEPVGARPHRRDRGHASEPREPTFTIRWPFVLALLLIAPLALAVDLIAGLLRCGIVALGWRDSRVVDSDL